MWRTACVSRKRTVPVFTAAKATKKARLYRPDVTLARVRAPSGSARTELARVRFFSKIRF